MAFSPFLFRDGEKTKNSRPCIIVLGQEIKSCGATRLDVYSRPLCAYDNMQTLDNGVSSSGLPNAKMFQLALESPFSPELLYRTSTIGGSL
ncbi:MAG: hypothetical protein PUJ09_04930 [Eubacteriales bacterium]|nr:hypothetical protein [Eubacteriales bacterium]